jgi:DNA-directed RNA polymerase specialized sigma24 family protein
MMRNHLSLVPAYDASFTGDASRAVGEAWPMFAPALATFAQRLAEDEDDQADLLQEALIELWKIDPTRFDLRHEDERAYLYRALVNRMWDVWGGAKHRFEAMADPEAIALAAKSFLR